MTPAELKRYQERFGSVAAFCEAIGVHRATFYRYLSGNLPIPGKIANAVRGVMETRG